MSILKIILVPLSLILSLFVWLCAGLLSCSGFVFKLASGLLSLLAIAVMITYSVKNGIILLVLAFLISPMGLPLLAVPNGEVTNNYSDAALVWNPTLKHYSTHLALDFTSDDLNVYAAADGTIKEIGYNQLDGNYVVLSHSDGYVTRYLSLESPCALKVGDKIKHGQLLGKMSASQGNECLDGAHLHFEMLKDGEYVNPLEVLVNSDK